MTILLNLFTRSVVGEVTIKYHIILNKIFSLLFSSMSCYNMLELCLISTSGVQIRSMHTYRHEGGFLFVLKSVIFSTKVTIVPRNSKLLCMLYIGKRPYLSWHTH